MGEGSGREGGKGCSADYIASRASQNNRGYKDMLDTAVKRVKLKRHKTHIKPQEVRKLRFVDENNVLNE